MVVDIFKYGLIAFLIAVFVGSAIMFMKGQEKNPLPKIEIPIPSIPSKISPEKIEELSVINNSIKYLSNSVKKKFSNKTCASFACYNPATTTRRFGGRDWPSCESCKGTSIKIKERIEALKR